MYVSSEPLVSIVLPSYNHSKYIERSIMSAIDQTYKNIELIVIDDGSIDRSPEIILSLASICHERFTRFEWRHRPNKGVSATLNEGIAWAKGAFFSGLSSDDIMLPHKTEFLLKELNSAPSIAGIFGGCLEINANGEYKRSLQPPLQEFGFEEVALKKCKIYGIAQLMRVEALLNTGCYDERQKLEDWPTYLRITDAGYRFKTVPEVVAKYRKHKESFSSSKVELLHRERLKALTHYSHRDAAKMARALVLVGFATQFYDIDKRKSRVALYDGIKCDPWVMAKRQFWRAVKIQLLGKIRQRLKRAKQRSV